MAPGQEIAIRAVGTALAGLSLAAAVQMLAYGGAMTRVDGAERVAMFAEAREQSVKASPREPPATPIIDMATTGSLPAAGKPAWRSPPAEIGAAKGATLLAVAASANGGGRRAALAAVRFGP
jgi:hypothetical protein